MDRIRGHSSSAVIERQLALRSSKDLPSLRYLGGLIRRIIVKDEV